MKVSQRALLGLVSVGAVFVPAVSIAYLGAVSYRDDRGIVAAKVEEQFRAAWGVAQNIERELTEALGAAREAAGTDSPAVSLRELRARHVLASRPFLIGPGGRLVFPAPHLLRSRAPLPERPAIDEPCRGSLARCVRVRRAIERRSEQLATARQKEAEACPPPASCDPKARRLAEATRIYRTLTAFPDAAPDALLGLARIARRTGSAVAARAAYEQLASQYGGVAGPDGVPYALIAELGVVEATGTADGFVELYARLVDREYSAPSSALTAFAERARLGAIAAGEEGNSPRLAEVDARFDLARADAAFASTLVGEVDDMFRTASTEPRGRQSLLWVGRTVVFQRTDDGGVVGLVLEAPMVNAASASAAAREARFVVGARAKVHRFGERPTRDVERTIASASFGSLLPHLALSVVVGNTVRDPLDLIVERRGRRHLLITGGLVALLMVGLVATIRGAARERELARLKSEFVSTVSHELKTPLTSIRMFAEMLREGVAGKDRARETRYHDVIVKESERLGLLIANLLDYSQIERGTRRYAEHREQLGSLAREAVATFRRLREGENQEVELEIGRAAERTLVSVDRDVLVQSVLNLLSNAAKYSGGGPIHVGVGLRGADRVALDVRDCGPGIPISEQIRIFREFYRAPSAYKSQVEGTGLGLALVKRHVEAQGGTVEVNSAEGAGATFSIVLPVHRA